MENQSPLQASPLTSPSKGGKNKGILIVMIILVVVFIGGGFILISKMLSGSSNTSNSALSTPTDAPPKVAPIIEASYICQDKKTMKVTYDSVNNTAKVVLSDGRTLDLTQQETGSGTQYANSDGSIILYGKGSLAFLEENGKQTYKSCGSGS